MPLDQAFSAMYHAIHAAIEHAVGINFHADLVNLLGARWVKVAPKCGGYAWVSIKLVIAHMGEDSPPGGMGI